MDLEELLNFINFKKLNIKTNNCIIEGLSNKTKTYILENINKQSPVMNFQSIDEEGFIIKQLINIIVDLDSIEYYNILNFALEQLKIEERIKLTSIRDLLKFKNILIKNRKAIQLIIINPSSLNESNAKIFNLLLWINSFLFNIIILLEEQEKLSSYQIPNETFLDNRENYSKIKLRKR